MKASSFLILKDIRLPYTVPYRGVRYGNVIKLTRPERAGQKGHLAKIRAKVDSRKWVGAFCFNDTLEIIIFCRDVDTIFDTTTKYYVYC